MIDASIAGLLTGLSLIVAIGAQNAYVLRQGILRSHVGAVVAQCTIADVILISAGVGGVGALVDRAHGLLTVLRWIGVAFLVWYAVSSLRRALHAEALAAADAGREPLGKVLAKIAALTWLNPHVYLDTLVFHGSIAATYGDMRWWFALGACVASAIWFAGLGYGAALAAPLLASPRAWRVLDIVIAVTMLGIAVRLAFF
ncbi:MAG: amino acid transporter [Nocardioides sp.]|nr:amino acid transporter [Nocardioides sp.]